MKGQHLLEWNRRHVERDRHALVNYIKSMQENILALERDIVTYDTLEQDLAQHALSEQSRAVLRNHRDHLQTWAIQRVRLLQPGLTNREAMVNALAVEQRDMADAQASLARFDTEHPREVTSESIV